MRIITRQHYNRDLATYWLVTEEQGEDASQEQIEAACDSAISMAIATGSVGSTHEEADHDGVNVRVTVRKIVAVRLAVPYGAEPEPMVAL
jgi:hypothetical protein